jgi:hypothetical protein
MTGTLPVVQHAWIGAMNLGPFTHAHSQKTTGHFHLWHFIMRIFLHNNAILGLIFMVIHIE